MTSAPHAPFGRMLTAMCTAFAPDGSVDLDATARIADHLITHGHDGVVVSGTTGESPTTTAEEDGETLRAVKDAVGGRGSVVAGIGTNSTATTLELVEQATRCGADGLLLVTPYYNKPGQAGVLQHFQAVSQATDLPVMLYDVPGRTGTTIDLATYEAASKWDNVIAVKDATGLISRSALLTQLGLAVYSGDDANTMGYLSYGACGLVSVVGHAAGVQLKTMIEAFLAGDHAKALEIHLSLVPAFDAMMGAANYGATTAKAALQLLGVLDNRRVRGPLAELDADELAAVTAGLVAANLLPN